VADDKLVLSDKTIKDLVAVGVKVAEAKLPSGATVPYAIVPTDCRLETLEGLIYNDFAERPHRKKGTVTVHDAASFVEYYTLFCDEHSRVFADESRSSVLAILDYHGAGENAPRWGQHRIQLTLQKSKEWEAWVGANGSKFIQSDFALFVEDNAPDIERPAAATMLELASSLQATIEANFESGIRLQNGQVQLTYKEQVNGTFGANKFTVPESFTIRIPVYIGSAAQEIKARLRFRPHGGKLSIWYDLLRPEQYAKEAFTEMLAVIEKGLPQTKIIRGVPAQ
jgi:uncharacterized protein YfdQ (DUF2303 family)